MKWRCILSSGIWEDNSERNCGSVIVLEQWDIVFEIFGSSTHGYGSSARLSFPPRQMTLCSKWKRPTESLSRSVLEADDAFNHYQWLFRYFCGKWPPKRPWTLQYKRYNWCWVTGVPDLQISERFTLPPAACELQNILRIVHRMTPN